MAADVLRVARPKHPPTRWNRSCPTNPHQIPIDCNLCGCSESRQPSARVHHRWDGASSGSCAGDVRGGSGYSRYAGIRRGLFCARNWSGTPDMSNLFHPEQTNTITPKQAVFALAMNPLSKRVKWFYHFVQSPLGNPKFHFVHTQRLARRFDDLILARSWADFLNHHKHPVIICVLEPVPDTTISVQQAARVKIPTVIHRGWNENK